VQEHPLARALVSQLESALGKADLVHRCSTFEGLDQGTYADVPLSAIDRQLEGFSRGWSREYWSVLEGERPAAYSFASGARDLLGSMTGSDSATRALAEFEKGNYLRGATHLAQSFGEAGLSLFPAGSVNGSSRAVSFGQRSPFVSARAELPGLSQVNRVDSSARVDDGLQYFSYYDGANWKWPESLGFSGAPNPTTLSVGTRLDRVGGPQGSFLAPAGTPWDLRSLAPGSAAERLYRYEVIRPLPVIQGEIAPAFGYPGGGTQMLPNFGSRANVQWLLENGYIKELR
ncbi:MAG: TNT domain-containing protein, partial [Ottowia sp.]|nr:TNT domain-containing protein [Ottowia sp.]